MVIDPVSFRLSESAAWARSFTPSKLNACPTLPAANVAPLNRLALFGPFRSAAVLSAVHQLISPLGGATDVSSARVSRVSTPMRRARVLRGRRGRDRVWVENSVRIGRFLGVGVWAGSGWLRRAPRTS